MESQERLHLSRLFASQMRRPDAEVELDRAALYLAGDEYPLLDVDAYLRRLDQLATQVRDLAGGELDPPSVIKALNHLLFDQMGFTGNTEDFYNVGNNLLNRVLDTGAGMPIALSVVYLELARRLNIPGYGVGLPGHFVVRLDDLDLYLDPFNNGQVISAADCRRMVGDNLGPHWSWREEYLSPYSKKDIIYRLLNNIKSIYLGSENYPGATVTLTKMALIIPASPQIHRDLAWCYANLGQENAALRHLANYLSSAWPSQEASEMQRQVEALWSVLRRLGQQSG
jgi:regulator of sirC expression with transglutaminase-like and TPR domain